MNTDKNYPILLSCFRWIKKDNVGFLRFHQRREKKFKLFSSLIKRKVIDSKGNWTEFEVTKNTRICSNHFQDGRPIDENPHPSLLMKRYDENSSLSSPADRTNTPTSSGKKLKPPTLKGFPGTRGSRRQRLKEAEKRSFKSKIWKPKSALL